MKRAQAFLFFLSVSSAVFVFATKPPDLKVTKEQAKAAALDFYAKRVTPEPVGSISVPTEPILLQLDFPVPKFSKEGEWMWEVRIGHVTGRVQAIIWVHTQTGKVHYLIGK